MNPYVTARFGRYTKGDGLRRTPAVAADGAAAGRDVSFESLGNRRTLIVPRMPNDGGLCYVDVWHDTGGSAGQHIGSAVIAAPPDGEFQERVLGLWDDGGERGGNSMGTLRVRMRMHDKDGGRLGLQFVEANGLHDVTAMQQYDSDSFHDNKIVSVALSVFGVYLVVGTIFYDLFFRDCEQPTSIVDTDGIGRVAERSGNATTDLIGDSFTDPSNTHSNLVGFGEEVNDANCASRGGWENLLDALVFQFTSVTTVGYGTHPKNIDTDASMLLTVLYIICGMGLMGVMAGAIGEALLRTVEKHTERLAHLTEDAVILGIDTTASGAKIAGGVAGSVGSIVSGGAGVSSPTEEERRQQPGSDDVSASTEEGRRQQADMGVMLQEEKKEEKEEMAKATKRRYLPATELLASLGGMAMIVMIGTRAYMYFDEHSFVPALYFTVITVTTVGFGDIAPQSVGSRIFSIIFVPIGVVFFANALSVISGIPLQQRKARLEDYVLNQFGSRLSRYDFSSLKRSVDLGKEDSMSKNDFSLAMLLRLGRIKPRDLAKIEEVFFKLDANGSGFLDPDDLEGVLTRAAAEGQSFEVEAPEDHTSKDGGGSSMENPLSAPEGADDT